MLEEQAEKWQEVATRLLAQLKEAERELAEARSKYDTFKAKMDQWLVEHDEMCNEAERVSDELADIKNQLAKYPELAAHITSKLEAASKEEGK